MLYREVWYMVMNIPKEFAASIFRTEKQVSWENVGTVVANIGQVSGPRAMKARRWIIVALNTWVNIS